MNSSHVAVIVVHGVGDPGANSSVDNVASILLAQRDPKQQRTLYEPFACEGIQVGVRPAPVPGQSNAAMAAPASPEPRWWLDERAPGIIRKQKHLADREPQDEAPDKVATESELPADIAYTRDQLHAYRVKPDRNEATYATTRLTGVRRGVDGVTEKTVHLYELYWADLVSLRKGFRLLEDLYQLFLHLAHIGLLAMNAAMAEKPYGQSCLWKGFAWCHRWAVRTLTLPIPILNLMAIPVTAFALSALIPGSAMRPVALALAGILLVVGSGLVCFMCNRRGWQWLTRQAAAASIGIVAILIGVACALSVWASEFTVGMMAFSAGMAGVVALLAGYEKIRPGAFRFAIVVGAIVLFVLLNECAKAAGHEDPHRNLSIALRVGGGLLLLLGTCWMALCAFSVLALFFGMFALWTTSSKDRTTARGFAGTALLSLGVTTVAFYLLTTFVSTGVLFATLKHVGERPYEGGGRFRTLINFDKVHSAVLEKVLKPVLAPCPEPPRDRNLNMVAGAYWSAIAGVPLIPIVTLLAFSVVLLTWVIAPSMLSELSLPKDDSGPAKKAYGRWLDRSRMLLRTAVGACCVAGLGIWPLGIVGMVLIKPECNQSKFDFFLPLLNRLFVSLGTLIAGVGAIWLLPQRLGKWFDGLSVPIRAALDVDAYLRLFPLDGNPRARIFARYSSLLRFIANWTSPLDKNVRYDSVVIVAHSQGTVISADLFRYLKRSGAQDESLKRILCPDKPKDKLKVRLLTMGCPLRQLYGSRFPHMYGWAAETKTIGAVQTEVGVDQWINAYRSGDYVGRYLWDEHDYWAKQYTRGTAEFCVGPGAHVHYWDGTAPVVARAIDDLITT